MKDERNVRQRRAAGRRWQPVAILLAAVLMVLSVPIGLTPAYAVDLRDCSLTVIPGNVPDLSALPEGCSFGPRCGFFCDKCGKGVPELVEVEPNHWVRCYRPGGVDRDN